MFQSRRLPLRPLFFRLQILAFALLGAGLPLSGCGGGNDASESSNLLGGGLQVGQVRALIFDENNVAKTSFSELSGEEEFSLLLFAANPQPASYPVQIQSLSLSGDKALSLPSPLHEDEDDEPAANARAHVGLREREAEFVGEEPYHPSGDGKALATGGSCAGGRGVFLKVLTSLSNTNSYTRICAVEVRSSNYAVYYVDESVLGEIPGSALDEVINGFEQKIPYEKALLGNESDVDENGRIAVFFTPGVNRLGAESGGFVTGFFFGGDLFPEPNNPSSNQGEILFSCVPDPKGEFGVPLPVEFWVSNIAAAVLPHEFQHMISFNQKVLMQGVSPEEPWMNEGLSHFIEDLRPQPGISPNNLNAGNLAQLFSEPGKENPSRVQLYLASPQTNPFTAGISLAQRGGSYLALKYIFEQANQGRYPQIGDGGELLRGLLANKQKGIDNLEATTGWTFKDILLDFYATLQLSGTGVSQDPRYEFQGICLTCEQDDNRGTVLEGVQTVPLAGISGNGTVSAPGGIFFTVEGSTLSAAGQGLSFMAAPDMIAGGAVIRTR